MDAWRSMRVRDARENLPPRTPRLCGDSFCSGLRCCIRVLPALAQQRCAFSPPACGCSIPLRRRARNGI